MDSGERTSPRVAHFALTDYDTRFFDWTRYVAIRAAHRHVGPSNGTIYLGNHAGLFTVPGAQTQLDIFNREGWGYTDALARTANLDSFASFCVACESTLVSTDESLPQDHDPEGDHTESRACVPSVPGR